MHDPETGRFTALDPIGAAGGDNDWYGYCLDDPVNAIDPLGLKGSAGGRIFRSAAMGAGAGGLRGAFTWNSAMIPVGLVAGFTKGLLVGTIKEYPAVRQFIDKTSEAAVK